MLHISVDLEEHELRCLLKVLHLIHESDVVGVHARVAADCWLVRNRVLVLGVSAVEDAFDLTGDRAGVVHLEVLKVEGHPAAVDEDAALLALGIEVGQERRDDLDALLTVAKLLNLDLVPVIEDSSHLHLLERVLILKGIKATLGSGPGEGAAVLRGDVDGRLGQEGGPASGLHFLVLLATSLELVTLMREDHCGHRE